MTARADVVLRMRRLVSRIATLSVELDSGRLDGYVHVDDVDQAITNIEQELDEIPCLDLGDHR